MDLTQERVRHLFIYDFLTGEFKRRVAAGSGGRIPAGTVVGSTRPDGYLKILIDGKSYLAHRLAWFYVNGVWPTYEIDHINGVKADNRIENMRDVPSFVNRENRHRAQRDNKLGVLGVVQYPRGFAANIKINGKPVYLGYFSTAEAAHAAYVSAKRRHHEGCTI